MAAGKTMRVFLVDGVSSGIVVAEIINWTGQVSRVPKPQLANYLLRPDSTRTGVYVLTGPDDESPDRLRVYIGESDNIGARLKQHVLDQTKDYWETAYAITSKDGNITKSHALFLESLIIRNARSSDRHIVENKRSSLYENMPESDRSDMLMFNEQVEVMLATLGLDLFSPLRVRSDAAPIQSTMPNADANVRQTPLPRPTSPDAETMISLTLRDDKHGVHASGFEIDGKIVVEVGSKARAGEIMHINSYGPLRSRLLSEGVLVPNDEGSLTFTRDHLFDSPSAASAIILNRNDNGRQSWKVTATGQTLNQLYAERISSTTQSAAAEEMP